MNDKFDLQFLDDNAINEEIDRAYNKFYEQYTYGKKPGEKNDIVSGYKKLKNSTDKYEYLSRYLMSIHSTFACQVAEMELRDSKPLDAIRTLDRAIKVEEYPLHLYYLKGIACMSAGKFSRAIKAYEWILTKLTKNVEFLASHAIACLENKNYKKAIASAKKGYSLDKNNYALLLCLSDAYINSNKFANASEILTDALKNTSFKEKKFDINVRLAYSYYLARKYEKFFEYMERLPKIPTFEKEKREAGELFLNTIDFYLDKNMYNEAMRCINVLIELLPGRADIVEIKNGIERFIKYEDEFNRFEEDKTITDELVGLISFELFPTEATGMDEEEKKAFIILSEYQIILDFSIHLMPIRYLKNKYPLLYDLKEDFFNNILDAKKRKVLKTKYQIQIEQYRNIFEDLVDKYEEELNEIDDENSEEASEEMDDQADIYENIYLKSFLKSKKSSIICPCGSGKSYYDCCGKKDKH